MSETVHGKYGTEFQYKVFAAFLKDPVFFKRSLELSNSSYFVGSGQWLFEIFSSYYKKYKAPPTFDVLKSKLKQEKEEAEDKKSAIINILTNFKSSSFELQYVKDEFTSFCLSRNIKQLVYDQIENINNGIVDMFKAKMDVIYRNAFDSIGEKVDYKEDLDNRYMENARNPCSSGFDVIDNNTKGGIGDGELWLVAGGTAAGKTWLGIKAGLENLIAGKRVLHISLELNKSYIGQRYDAMLTNIHLDDLKNSQKRIKRQIDELPGTLKIYEYSMNSYTPDMLRADLDELKFLDEFPDIVILDYCDIMKFSLYGTKSSKTEMQEHNVIELRGIAKDYKTKIITFAQVNRDGYNSDDASGDNLAGAFARLFHADFGAIIVRNEEFRAKNVAKFKIIKNRNGPEDWFPAITDLAHGQIDMFAKDSNKGMEIINLMNKDIDQSLYEDVLKRLDNDKKISDIAINTNTKNENEFDDLFD